MTVAAAESSPQRNQSVAIVLVGLMLVLLELSREPTHEVGAPA